MGNMRYKDFFGNIIGRKLNFDDLNDRRIATNLNFFFDEKDDYAIFNGQNVMNVEFFKTLSNKTMRNVSKLDEQKALFLKFTLAERRYSQIQREMLAGLIAVANKIPFKKDEPRAVFEIKSMIEGTHSTKVDEVVSTLVVDAVRISKKFDDIFDIVLYTNI